MMKKDKFVSKVSRQMQGIDTHFTGATGATVMAMVRVNVMAMVRVRVR